MIKVNRGNSEYTCKKNVRLHTLLTIIKAFYARGFYDPANHKQHKFDSFTFTESATGLSYAEIA